MGHLLGARAWVAEPSPGTATWEEVASGLARAAGKAEGQEGSLGGGGAGAQPAGSGLPRCPGRRLERRAVLRSSGCDGDDWGAARWSLVEDVLKTFTRF